jgi:hypothetical protein
MAKLDDDQLQSAFTTTVRVVDRVHDHTANGRTNTAPTHRTSFTDLAQAVFGVADFTDGCAAFDVHATHFTRAQTHLSVGAFTGHQHNAGAGGTGHLGTLARQHFDAVDGGTDWDVADRQAVTGLIGASEPLISCRQPPCLWGDDVALAVGVAQQSDVRGTVRIVFDTFNLGRDTILVATEVDTR